MSHFMPWRNVQPLRGSSETRRSASDAEFVAQAFHETYEELAPLHGYKTRKASAVPWDDVPSENKALMVNVAHHLLELGVISHGATQGRTLRTCQTLSGETRGTAPGETA